MDSSSADRQAAAPSATSAPSASPKKPTSSLLPAFEPFSSSPDLPRPLKRTRDAFEERPSYPTPVPTSSTHILSSSSPSQKPVPRPSALIRTQTVERAPLATVPSIVLNADGQPTRLGRSSASSDFQLSSNRLISRVHVVATYKAAHSSLGRDQIEIKCNGWNGIKVHCQGKAYDLKKGSIFTSDLRDSEIMLDIHDSRVVLQWPEKAHLGPNSSDEEDLPSPSKRQRALLRHSTPPSPSPVQIRRAPISPVSPTPINNALLPSSPPIASTHAHADVEIYEDLDADQENIEPLSVTQPSQAATHILSQQAQSSFKSQQSFPSPVVDYDDDNDEENDPVVHSFGPFGANLLPRLANFNTADTPRPENAKKTAGSLTNTPLQPVVTNSPTHSPGRMALSSTNFDIKSHLINQLAFSRLSSTPLSTILSNLPSEAGRVTKSDIRGIVTETDCVGEVTREGKDAAGKVLESEYYYIPEKDEDEKRKEAVVNDLQKPGLRACRKQHKQYFWRKPK